MPILTKKVMSCCWNEFINCRRKFLARRSRQRSRPGSRREDEEQQVSEEEPGNLMRHASVPALAPIHELMGQVVGGLVKAATTNPFLRADGTVLDRTEMVDLEGGGRTDGTRGFVSPQVRINSGVEFLIDFLLF